MGNAAQKPNSVDDSFMDELSPGTELLQGQFIIEQFLNSGGFGITYLAKDSLDRKVVIKECFPSSFCNRSRSIVQARSRAHTAELKSVVELFVQEARSLAKLDHPNIVGVHQVFEDNQTAYMVLDFVEGRDLLDTLEDKNHGLTPQQIKGLLTDILGAVQFIHDKDILHRDISPDNILIDADMRPVLIDFGAAREEATKKSRVLSAMRVVKDGYSPQEFYVQGSAQTPSSDLYALAATFYHLIAGDIPPNSQARLAAIASGEKDPYTPLAGRIRGYDTKFLSAVDKALGILPKDRLQSANDWLNMMHGNRLSSRVISQPAPVSSAAAATQATKQRSKLVPLLGSVAVIAILAVGGLAMSGKFTLPGAQDTAQTPVDTPAIAPVQSVQTPASPVEMAEVTLDEPIASTVVPTEAAAEPWEEPEVLANVEIPDAAAEVEAMIAQVAAAAGLSVEELNAAQVADFEAPLDVSLQETAAANAEPEVPVTSQPEQISAEVQAETVQQTNVAEVVTAEAPEIEILSIAEPAPVAEDTTLTSEIAVVEAPSFGTEAPAFPAPSLSAEPTIDFAALAPAPAVEESVAPVEDATVAATVTNDAAYEMRLIADLPFGGAAGSNTIETVADISPTWVTPGAQVIAVNDVIITDFADINAIVEAGLAEGDAGRKELTFSVKADETSAAEAHVWSVPLKHQTVLSNGVTFEAVEQNGTWVTRVLKAPGGRNALKTGDIVVAYMATSEKLTDQNTLRDILTREAENGTEQLNFAVMREDSIWVVSMTQTGGA